MISVVILTDGPYGDRAYDTIKEEFVADFIQLEPPSGMFLDDEIELPKDAALKIENANIIISYISHPDLALDIVYRFADKVDWIIVASWKGDGFKNQLESKNNVSCPYIMCEIEENGNPIYDEFLSKIGKPKVELILENGKVNDINVIRSSPCGSTSFVADYILEKYKGKIPDEEILPREAGLKIQHYPCRAGKMRLFTDEECKKQMASGFHQDTFKEAIEK
ncbi:hypothetical protein MARBORIA2_06330 [Methanobrevibacter arboriphilus]|jgi:hypothetical protein|uniref:Uncharacterized protein n=1 Tax=Methanobrevibacter arboriphilus TaxID=39441 RepID=A0ACA8R105_METAZ|nr:DUF166 family protein [Methanobrevibacter arboriphilus]MCC7562775.1 hypothetical protein [Methanobrevibacter arboriphilus]BBL61019.1 hypothetical protein MarbSA_00590 [Methanobrevibacter arboriphilus]GLI11543.1 hypothetical protein MARBORIA2_06330 [Methanobrevibacter arboriphilus]